MSIIDAQREARGQEPLTTTVNKLVGAEEYAKAEKANADGQKGSALVNELLGVNGLPGQPRQLNTEEIMILAHEQLLKTEALYKATHEFNTSDKPSDKEFLRNNMEAADGALTLVQTAARMSGTLNAQAFAFRAFLQADRATAPALREDWVAFANHGVGLSHDQNAYIELFAAEMVELSAAVAETEEGSKARTNAEADKAKKWGEHQKKKLKEHNKNDPRTIGDMAVHASLESGLLMKALMTIHDASFVGSQGLNYVSGHPIKAFLNFFGPTMKAFWSAKGQYSAMQRVYNHPNYAELTKGAGLFIAKSEISPIDGFDEQQDEATLSSWVERLPLAKSSMRGFNTFLNVARFDIANGLYTADGTGNLTSAKHYATLANVATGRGGPDMGDATKMAGAAMFSIRLQLARLQFAVAPFGILRAPREARLRLYVELGRMHLGRAALATAATLWASSRPEEEDTEVSWELDSSDAGKLRVGNRRIEIMGGMMQQIVLANRLVYGTKTNLGTGEKQSIRPTDAIKSFLRNKTSPLAGATIDLLEGTNVVGNPKGPLDFQGGNWISGLTGAKVPAFIADAIQPLIYQEIIAAGTDQDRLAALAYGILSFTGFFVSTFDPNAEKVEGEGGTGKVLEEYGGEDQNLWPVVKEFSARGMVEFMKVVTPEEPETDAK